MESKNIIISTGKKNTNINMSQEDCPICIESYNRSTRSKVTCGNGECGFSACKSCTRQYLLSSTQDPHCMSCKQAWTHDFMIASLNRSYMNADYRKHRSHLLMEREIAKLPESMELAANETKARDFDKVIQEKNDELSKLRAKMRELERERHIASHEAWNLRNPGKEAKQTRQFIMPCPKEDCRGFLSSQYKCEICKFHTCSHCLEVIGLTKEGHECDPDTVATANAIKAQTKPCPKCGTRISKISGCDQMWCVGCHTAFSWRTGEVDTGIVHNPHFFQFQRQAQAGGGAAAGGARQIGLNQCNQEQLPYWYSFNRSVLRKVNNTQIKNDITAIYRLCAHLRRAEIIPTQRKIRTLSNNSNYRVKYLLNEMDKEELAKKLFSNDKLRRRLVETVNVMDLLENIGRETILGLYNSPLDDLTQLATNETVKFREISTYCNTQFDSISKLYKVNQMKIHDDLDFTYTKRK